jgi:hypothetical protein
MVCVADLSNTNDGHNLIDVIEKSIVKPVDGRDNSTPFVEGIKASVNL